MDAPTQPQQTTPVRRAADRALVAIFLLGITAPGLGLLLGFGARPVAGENRTLAPPPSLGAGLGQARRQAERWFDDHFAFRDRLVTAHSLLAYELFATSSSPDVVVGRRPWLFFAQDHIIEARRGLRPFTPAALEAWQRALEQRRDWLARRNISYVLVVAPEKSSVYPEMLPAALQPGAVETRLDQLLAWMAARSTVPLLDLRPALLAAKAGDRVFQQTDTHWNDVGLFAAHHRLEEWLATGHATLRPLDPGAFRRQVSIGPGGDLAGMLALVSHLNEEAIALEPLTPLPCHPEALTPLLQAHPAWRPAVYTCPDAEIGRALFVHDSFFGTPFQPLLARHFRRAVFVRSVVSGALAADEAPDVVIEELVERLLSRDGYLPPAELPD